jgi:hypothetical protein
MNVETREFSDRKKLKAMENWLDKHIGLEYERCYPTGLPTNITIFGVEPDEYDRISKVDWILSKLEEVSEYKWAFPNAMGKLEEYEGRSLVRIIEKLEEEVDIS